MDFDLFEFEDDEILSSVCIQNEQTALTTTTSANIFPEFNCFGEDSLDSHKFGNESFIKNGYLFRSATDTKTIELTEYKFKENILYTNDIFEYFIGRCRLNIQSLVANSKFSKNIECNITTNYEMRKEITMFLHLIRSSNDEILSAEIRKGLEVLRTLLNRIVSADILKSVYLANSSGGNECNTPSYHFLHGFLEWKIIDLIILSERLNEFQNALSLNDEQSHHSDDIFILQFNILLKNLLIISTLLFKKTIPTDLINISPFPCTCIKEIWLLMQFLIEKTENGTNFWSNLNKNLIDIQTNFRIYDMSAQQSCLFNIWMLRSLVKLQGFKRDGHFDGNKYHRVIENYEIVENTIECFISLEPKEEQLRVFLNLLSGFVIEWWPPKVTIPMSLWEYYHKKLGSSFYITGSAPGNLAIVSTTGKGYLDKIDIILENSSIIDRNQSSYTIFLMILGKTIQKFSKIGQNNHVNKILGRIYSKFSLSKLLTLNETGLHHLIELFLMLAKTGDFIEIAQKLRDKLLSIVLKNLTTNRQISLIRGHMALLILFSENRLDMTDYIVHLIGQIEAIKNDVSVLKVLAESLNEIFENTEIYDCGEHLFIDNWLVGFLSSSLPAEQERLLEIIYKILEKMKNSPIIYDERNNSEELLKLLCQHILPFVKQNFISGFSSWIPKLAANFCILNASGTDPINNFQKQFRYFIEANCASKQCVPKFLISVLLSNKCHLIESAIIIQVWLKSLVLLSANDEDVMELTKIVVTLNDFHNICNIPAEDLLTAKEPLCVFVSAIGRTYNSCQDFNKKQQIAQKFNETLVNFEKWLADKNEKTEIIFRFYSFIAIIIFNCSDIVYSKSKITCFFHIAMTRYILPVTLQMGKSPEPKIVQIVHKIWPVILQGIGRLNFKCDPYLMKTLNDLIIKWTPHFKISSNFKLVSKPFLCCITADNDALTMFILEKLCSNFIAMQRRQAGPHTCLVITIFQEAVNALKENIPKMILFVKITIISLLEHIMMVDSSVPSKNLCLEILKKIVNSNAYKNSTEVKELLIENLKVITVKHLPFSTFFYFELLTNILHVDVSLIQEILQFLREQMKIVEEKRGAGPDNRLRSCYDKLNDAILIYITKK